jgi:hypothetical protein
VLHHKIALRRTRKHRQVVWPSIDIEERKRSETLRESEERYRAPRGVAADGLTTPADGWTIFANQWWYGTGARTRRPGFDPIHPDHQSRMWKSWRQTVASGREWIEEAPLRRAADGNTAGTCFVAGQCVTPMGGSF